jgi:tRNA modification GTPase
LRSNTSLPENTRPPEPADGHGNDTIVAPATPPGKGGIGIVRLSGPRVGDIACHLTGGLPEPRHATLQEFRDSDGEVIDQGIVIHYPSPHSYTGEDVLELQGHGSPVALDMLLRRCLQLGARIARPGEFSERAFLSGQLDLAQAEAVADLIESSTEAAARSALNALRGVFSRQVEDLADELTGLRVHVESAIDFPEEEIDFLADGEILRRLESLEKSFARLRSGMGRGRLLRDGFRVVLSGPPNVGKSSLLNYLLREQRAIVSDIPGTTRDVLEQYLDLDGLPVLLVDTAGIRESTDVVEAEGVRRAREARGNADLVLQMVDYSVSGGELPAAEPGDVPALTICNKIDLVTRPPEVKEGAIYLSAKTGDGVEVLVERIKAIAGYRESEATGFIARQRHIDALDRAHRHLDQGIDQLRDHHAGELLAEELRLAHHALGEITGEVSSDDLLGRIFSTFCIGK